MMNIQLDMKAAERRAPLIEKLHAIQEGGRLSTRRTHRRGGR